MKLIYFTNQQTVNANMNIIKDMDNKLKTRVDLKIEGDNITIPPTAYGDLQWNLTLFYLCSTLLLGIIVLVILSRLKYRKKWSGSGRSRKNSDEDNFKWRWLWGKYETI